MNRLAEELSPYLLQHANNPVDWYPWGEAAHNRARSENRPILLSIGYSACHWCHVMAHESFENDEIAQIMNANFINVKVDREERPDLDAIYQSVCQLVTRQGGWPLTVFLTPNLRPFYVGTYFPSTARLGRPGFKDLLLGVAKAWRERAADVLKVAEEWTRALIAMDEPGSHTAPDAPAAVSPKDVLRLALRRIVSQADRLHGGLGQAPKFPQTEALSLLLSAADIVDDVDAAESALFTLRRMAEGGVYDQVGGGFHRYAVDAAWQVPHFEKMLYDNALLPPVYLAAYQKTGDTVYADVARDILDYLVRDMRSPEGGFYSSTDADSPDGEGAFFTWTPQELEAALGVEDAQLAQARFGVTLAGNFPGGRTILHVAESVEALSRGTGRSPEETQGRLTDIRNRLRKVRSSRPKPGRDEKILAGWNGLVVSAFARAGQVFSEPADQAVARQTAMFLKQRFMAVDGSLTRRYAGGAAGLIGTLEDYAYVCQAFIDLYETDFDDEWLADAAALARKALGRFYDPPSGAFYLTESGQADLIHRPRAESDAGVPSPQSTMVRCLLRLSPYTGDDRMQEAAETVLERGRDLAGQYPLGMASFLSAYAQATAATEVVMVAEADDPTADEWIRRIRRRSIPFRVLSRVTPGAARGPHPKLTGEANRVVPIWEGRAGIPASPTVYVCRQATCSRPLTDWPAVDTQLSRTSPS